MSACACASGAEAIAAIDRERPDILLVDLKMDGLSGLDVIGTMRSLHPGCRAVLLTAAIRDDEAAQAIALGVSGILLKDSPQGTTWVKA